MALRRTRRGVCSSGFAASGVREGKYGVALIHARKPAVACGVFTRNSVKAAPVKVTRNVVRNGVSLVVANSGNANACTKSGLADARLVQRKAAEVFGVKQSLVALASTGIIGRKLDVVVVSRLVKKAAKKLCGSGSASLSAAKALMTTDTTPKQFSVEYKGIQVGGICKGAGMIAPDMATMLCFITTNAMLERKQLGRALKESVEESFSMLSIDGDQSTNDTVLLLASGLKKCSERDFKKALTEVAVSLAKMIAKDGEGAKKFVEVEVSGAKKKADARKAARAILSSPLVKTAVAGENPNWGRVMAKLGSVLKFDEKKVDITFSSERGSVKVARGGVCAGKKQAAARILKGREIRIAVDLNAGGFSARGWGCDLTGEYVKINAGYN